MESLVALLACGDESADRPVPVQVKLERDGWKLYRDGKPITIQGAGGSHALNDLAQRGGNSTRVWGIGPDTEQRLDEAHQNGISVAVGIWLEHEREGFDYGDERQVAEQTELVLSAVRKYKNHPAVLVWGVGNEMEGFGAGDNPAIWSHIEKLCQSIKQEDPFHPTMSVIAEIGGQRIPSINKFCPSLDIIGINAYGGAATLPKRYRDAGGNRPYIVTEFGPAGPWEVGRNRFGAVLEPTSNEKAQQYRRTYENLHADQQFCLGSYAFMWGHKQEATATWFGMFLQDGRKTNVVDVMQTLWTGQPPANRCPDIRSLDLVTQKDVVDAGEVLEFRLDAVDPEGDALQVDWQLQREADAYVTGGAYQAPTKSIDDAILESGSQSARIKAPSAAGIYRVYALVDDGSGAVATANLPFKVNQRELKSPGKRVALPYSVYSDSDARSDFVPAVRGGQRDAIEVDLECKRSPRSGNSCIQCRIPDGTPNAGISWRHPAGDDGEQPGGFDFTGANRLTVWAKGIAGGESLVIGIGELGPEHEYFDTLIRSKEITLTTHWKKYWIDFANADLRRVKTAFVCRPRNTDQAVEFFLDDITIETND